MKIIFQFLFLFLFVNALFGQQTDEEQAYKSLANKLYNEALQFTTDGDDVAALKALDQALFLDADFAQAYTKSAEIKMRQGNLDGALLDASKAISISEDYQAYQTRAEIYYKKGDFEKAKSDIARAKKLAGNSAPIEGGFENLLVNDMYEQGLQLIAQDQMENALDKFNEIITLNPDFANAYLQKGLIYADFADYTSALNNLEMSKQLQPSPRVDIYCVKVLLEMSRPEEAQQRFETIDAEKLVPEDAATYLEVLGELADLSYTKALEKQKSQDFQVALDNYQNVTELVPDFADSYFHMGEVFLQLENNARALVAFDKSIELNPTKNALLARGKLKMDLEDLDGAFDDLAQAKEMQAENADEMLMPSGILAVNLNPQNQNLAEPAEASQEIVSTPSEPVETLTADVVVVEELDEDMDGDIDEVVVIEEITNEVEPANERMSYFDAIDLADQLYKAGDMDAAINYYAEAARIDPEKNYPKSKISEIQNLDSAPVAPESRSYDDLIVGGDYYFGIKAYKNAKSKYQEALLLKPGDEYTLNQLKIIDDIMGDDEVEVLPVKDIDELPGKDAVSIDGTENESVKYYNEGLELYYDSDLEGALEKFRQAINLDPELVDAYYNSGFIKLNQADFEEAIADFDIVLSISPNDKAYFYKGRALMGLNRLEEAAIQYTMAIEMNPQFFYAYNNRGNVLFQLGEYEASVDDFTKAIAINPEYVFAYNNRGNAYFKLDKYPEALSDYNVAISLRPDYGFAYLNRGITHEILGDMDDACADWEKAAELGIQVGSVYYQEQCEKE